MLEGFREVVRNLEALGLKGRSIYPAWWAEAVEIFAPIQASEAARLRRPLRSLRAAIRDRLKWGASLSEAEVATLRRRHEEFRSRTDGLFAENELLLLPCAPVARIEAGADNSATRARILRYTAPFSLAGVPAIAIPCAHGGVQMASTRGTDEALLQLAAQIGAYRHENAVA